MNATCTLIHRADTILVEDAPNLTYLECLDDEEIFSKGDIIFKDGTQLFTLGGYNAGIYPDGLSNISDMDDVKTMRCRVLQPGDIFTITVKNEDD